MAEEVKTDDVQTEVDESKTFGEAEVNDLINKAVEEATGRLNSEFQKKFSQIKKEKEEAENGKLTFEEENRKMIDEMRLETQREKMISKSIKAYSEAGLKVPDDEVIADMIRLDSDDPLRVVKYNIAVAKEVAEKTGQEKELEFAQKHGRKVTDATMNMYDGLTYEELAGMSNDEFAKVPKQVVDKIMKTGE